MTQKTFQDVVFHADLINARLPDGSSVRFTRQERALLGVLLDRPGRLVPRTQLAGLLASLDSKANPRHVDFIINRLRAKLRDNVRAPIFIATQYGEGYIWVAAATAPDETPVSAAPHTEHRAAPPAQRASGGA